LKHNGGIYSLPKRIARANASCSQQLGRQKNIVGVNPMSVESIDSLPGARTVWRFSFGIVALAAIAAALSLLPFWDGFTDMWNVWTTYPEYGYSLLIPPVAAFLIWQQKDRLELVTFEGSWRGVLLVAGGGALLLLGQFGTIYTLVEYAYLVTLFGLVLAFTGGKAFRLLAMPLFVLVFMVPLPSFVFTNLSSKLQLLSSLIGVWFMRLFGISVFVEGNVIDLGGYKLQVAEACDGLRYLFPLLTLGFLMAYFYKGAMWKRVALFLSSFPITVIMNSFRIGTIGVMVEHWGVEMAEGFLHEFQGWLVFMASAALMLGEIAVLNRIGHETGTWRQLFGVEFPAPSPKGAMRRQRSIPPAFLGACALLAGFAAISWLAPRPTEIIPARESFIDFPMSLAGWTGLREPMEGIYLDQLKLDDYLLATYANGKGGSVDLYMAYYNSQRKGEAVHSPRACLPGGGWQLSEFDQRTVAEIKIDSQRLRVNRTLIALGDRRQLVYYWFEQRGRVITNEFAVKWYLFWDAITRHRTDGALVRLMTALPPNGTVADADSRLIDMASQLAPILARYIPD
jgi:exosortase D (VPLPA-CTERM-specific)